MGRRIDWREFHHFCLTYDGPSRGGNLILLSTSTAKEWAENVLLDTAPEGAMRLGTDATYERPLSGALDEVYIYASALDASAVAVLYDDVTAAPTVTVAPTGDFFEGSLVAYYPFDDLPRDAAGAHHACSSASRRPRPPPIGKDRGGRYSSAAASSSSGGCYRGHRPRLRPNICVLARVDSWPGLLFEYGVARDGEGWYRCLADGSIRAGVGCTSCDDCVATYNYTAYLAWSETTSIRCNLATETYTLRDAAGVVLDEGKMSHGACHYITCGASSYSYSYSDSSAAARRRLDGSASGYFMDGSTSTRAPWTRRPSPSSTTT